MCRAYGSLQNIERYAGEDKIILAGYLNLKEIFEKI